MYMVANVDAWTDDSQFRVPIIDFPGSESIREAFAIGRQEKDLHLLKEHRRLLGSLLSNPKPSDLVIYEYALETLRLVVDHASADVVEQIRAGVARMIVAVAQASGEGIGGSGDKVSDQERECIQQITTTLSLTSSEAASAILAEVL